jgi:hypothetical protein
VVQRIGEHSLDWREGRGAGWRDTRRRAPCRRGLRRGWHNTRRSGDCRWRCRGSR